MIDLLLIKIIKYVIWRNKSKYKTRLKQTKMKKIILIKDLLEFSTNNIKLNYALCFHLYVTFCLNKKAAWFNIGSLIERNFSEVPEHDSIFSQRK